MKKLLLIFCCLFSLVSAVAGNDSGVSTVKNPTEPEQVRKKASDLTDYKHLVVAGSTGWY
ncbi:MAG: hypothetical protein K2L84_02880 [Muribaculaceae bacterium]|nr:hypothetical protein [Muribaculaceae bacterium]